VDRDAHLLALCRYTARNPVAAGVVDEPASGPWSSSCVRLGPHDAPHSLGGDGLCGHVLDCPVRSAADGMSAGRRYLSLAGSAQHGHADSWLKSLNGQIFLGDNAPAQHPQIHGALARREAPNIPKFQCEPVAVATRSEWLHRPPRRHAAARLPRGGLNHVETGAGPRAFGVACRPLDREAGTGSGRALTDGKNEANGSSVPVGQRCDLPTDTGRRALKVGPI
jgi:hypothetical protein